MNEYANKQDPLTESFAVNGSCFTILIAFSSIIIPHTANLITGKEER